MGSITENGPIKLRPQAADVLAADELATLRRLSDKVCAAQEIWQVNHRRDNPDSVRLPIGELSQTALAEGFARSWAGDLAFDWATGEWLEWGIQGW